MGISPTLTVYRGTPRLRVDRTQRSPRNRRGGWPDQEPVAVRPLSDALRASAWHRVTWRHRRLAPRSTDPNFEREAADVIGLYLQPPRHLAVSCLDEKTAIRALDRLAPVLPLRVLVRASHEASRRSYGSPRVVKDLASQDIHVSRERVIRLCTMSASRRRNPTADCR